MFIPLHDANSLKHIRLQYVTLGLIAANVIVYLTTALGTRELTEAAVWGLGYIPSTVFDIAHRPPEMVLVPDNATYITYAFLHADIFHLGGNMLFLWVFGDNVEDVMGHGRFVLFYLLCGTAAAVGHSMLVPESTIPMIGASGAISGVLGAYLLLYPRATVRVLVIIILFITIIHVPALVVLGLWFAVQLFSAAAAPPDQPGIAFWAHVIGFVAGMALIPFFKQPHVRLLQPRRYRAWEIERRRGPWG
jgi:membrane associated rhomboid family serine protease